MNFKEQQEKLRKFINNPKNAKKLQEAVELIYKGIIGEDIVTTYSEIVPGDSFEYKDQSYYQLKNNMVVTSNYFLLTVIDPCGAPVMASNTSLNISPEDEVECIPSFFPSITYPYELEKLKEHLSNIQSPTLNFNAGKILSSLENLIYPKYENNFRPGTLFEDKTTCDKYRVVIEPTGLSKILIKNDIEATGKSLADWNTSNITILA